MWRGQTKNNTCSLSVVQQACEVRSDRLQHVDNVNGLNCFLKPSVIEESIWAIVPKKFYTL